MNTATEILPPIIANAPKENVLKVGEILVKNDPKLREVLGTLKEDLTTSNASALYTVAVASFIEEALKPTLVMDRAFRTCLERT